MASASPPLPDTRPTARPAHMRVRRIAVVLGGDRGQPLAWWMDPIRAILLIVLPIFCFAAYYNQFNYASFNASRDFVDARTFGLGIYSMTVLILGIVIGRLAVRRRDMVTLIDGEGATRALLWLGWIAIVAYVLLLGTLIAHLSLVLALLRGDITASSELRTVLGRIPGVTSFVQFGTVYLALVAVLVGMTNYTMTKRLWVMTAVIFGLAFARAILNSERLALLESVAAAAVVPLGYRWRPSLRRLIAPYLAVVVIFGAFAAGEYVRSWQFYKYQYDSYLDFITQRFFGYFSTAVNNGAGAYLIYGRDAPIPEQTVGWLTKFPVLGPALIHQPEISVHDRFLEMYATLEFNNPGGFYAAFLDYSFAGASAFMVALGCVIGAIYRSFQNRSLAGLLLYPLVFLGTTDLIRILYLPDTRTLPVFLGVGAVLYGLRPIRLPRDQFLGQYGRS